MVHPRCISSVGELTERLAVAGYSIGAVSLGHGWSRVVAGACVLMRVQHLRLDEERRALLMLVEDLLYQYYRPVGCCLRSTPSPYIQGA